MSKSYLTLSCAAQVMDAAQEAETLLKFLLPAYEVATIQQVSFTLPNALEHSIDVSRMGLLSFLAVRSTQPIDVSVHVAGTTPLFTEKPGELYLRVWKTPVAITSLRVKGVANAKVDISMAGRLTT